MIFYKFFFLFSFLCAVGVYAQDSTRRFISNGYIGGLGMELNIRERYLPISLSGDFSWQVTKKINSTFLALSVEPAASLVLTSRPFDLEYGIRIGPRFYQQLSPSFVLYQLIVSGPHFMSASIPRQARGFIFFDDFAVGLYYRISKEKQRFLNLQFRFRHMSNANFKQPNGGINTFVFLAGFAHLK